MPAVTGPNLSLSYGWTPRSGATPGDSGWGGPVTENFRKLDAVTQISVISRTLATPPASPSNGNRYIIPTGATGIWAGKTNQLAAYMDDAWFYYAPRRGWLADIAAETALASFDGSNWVILVAPLPYIDVYNPGTFTLDSGAALTLIPLTGSIQQVGGGWDSGTSKYTPPSDGVYLVEAMIRPIRSGTNSMEADVNLQLGFGVSPADNIDLVAATSPDLLPFTVSFCKPMRLAASASYGIYGKHSGAGSVGFIHGQLKITRLGA
jgi:hypothetical protein